MSRLPADPVSDPPRLPLAVSIVLAEGSTFVRCSAAVFDSDSVSRFMGAEDAFALEDRTMARISSALIMHSSSRWPTRSAFDSLSVLLADATGNAVGEIDDEVAFVVPNTGTSLSGPLSMISMRVELTSVN